MGGWSAILVCVLLIGSALWLRWKRGAWNLIRLRRRRQPFRDAAVERDMETGGRDRTWVAIASALSIAVALAAVDVATGYEINLGLFYLVPIAVVTWWVGLAAGLALGVACAGGMFIIDNHVTRDIPFPSHDLIPYWNSAIRLGYFVVFSWVLMALKRAHEREKALARQDFLTGAANGQAFFEHAELEIALARRTGSPFSVAYLDCDDFKAVNDRFGHAAGDEVLRETAAAARLHLRRSDLIARLGGDEFAVLLGNTGADEARRQLAGLRAALHELAARRDWPVTFSVGLVTYLTAPDDAEAMVRASDRLMYAVKKRGKNGMAHDILGVERGGGSGAKAG